MIYFYWGSRVMSFLRFMTLYSACKFNDNVTLIVRDGDEIPVQFKRVSLDRGVTVDYTPCLKHLNLNIVPLSEIYPHDKQVNEIYMSDIVGWYLLAYSGGTVADMDIVFFKPVPDFTFDVSVTFYPTKLRNMPIGFMQGRPNQFYVDVYNEAINRIGNMRRHQSVGENVLRATYYRYCSDNLFNRYDIEQQELSHELVYCFIKQGKNAINLSRKLAFEFNGSISDKAIGIHWYGGRNQDYNAMMTHKTFKAFDCAVTNVIADIVDDHSIFEEARDEI